MQMVNVQNLTKIYKGGPGKSDIIALDKVNLSVAEGEIFGLLGPNGAGKTTLFKILLSIVKVTSGSAEIMGLNPDNPDSRLKVGYLPENHRFPNHLTGAGLLELTGELHQVAKSQLKARIGDLLDLVGMAKWSNVKIRNYSKGMLQRVGLAQALVCDPDLLLLDEPTDGVDPVGKMEIRKVLQDIRAESKSIFLNSHLLSEVESVADRVAILSKGHVVKTSSVEELTSRKSQFKIAADMKGKSVDIPKGVGEVVEVTDDGVIVELSSEERINDVIDAFRSVGIPIGAIVPVKISLEQSFLETLGRETSEEGS